MKISLNFAGLLSTNFIASGRVSKVIDETGSASEKASLQGALSTSKHTEKISNFLNLWTPIFSLLLLRELFLAGSVTRRLVSSVSSVDWLVGLLYSRLSSLTVLSHLSFSSLPSFVWVQTSTDNRGTLLRRNFDFLSLLLP